MSVKLKDFSNISNPHHLSVVSSPVHVIAKQPSGKGSKLLRYVEHRLRVTLHDGRSIIGTFLAFDKHLNLVLSEAEEFRTWKKGGSGLLEERTEKRSLGLVLIRGENVVSLAVEGPPPPSGAAKAPVSSMGGMPMMGRGGPMGGLPPPGMGGAPMGLGAAPVHGVGAPGMMPPPPPPGGLPPPGMGRGMPPGF
jgi:small nuclear ribonucleoprotein B and B'